VEGERSEAVAVTPGTASPPEWRLGSTRRGSNSDTDQVEGTCCPSSRAERVTRIRQATHGHEEQGQ